MKSQFQTQGEAQTVSTARPTLASLMQRKCACGGTPGLDGECAECRAKRLAVQQQALNAQPADPAQSPAEFRPPSAGHDFSRVRVHGPGLNTNDSFHTARSAGRMSIRILQSSPPNRTGSHGGEPQDEQTIMTASTSGNRIDFTFDPTTSAPKPQCDEIVIVQLIEMTADGTPIMPGTYYTPWACRDAAALSSGAYIDHDCSCTTPYYTYCFNGTAGASDGVTRNATSIDAPMTAGGNRGFNSPTNPTGWQTVRYNFETYGFCAAGTDCGTWYDGVQWNYTKTTADHTAGRNGVSSATASLTPPGPGSSVVRAFNHFNSVKGFTPCTMSVIPRLPPATP